MLLTKFGSSYIHTDMLVGGGYVGYFCIEQNYVNDTEIDCGPKLSQCIGKGKMEFNNDSVPINENYFDGHCRKCKVSCNFNYPYYQLKGEYPLWYVLLYKKLKLLNSTISINENTYFHAWVENIHLIADENIEIKFHNNLFRYSDMKIKHNEIIFKVTVENNDFSIYVSRVDLTYGLPKCKKYFQLGYLVISKPNLQCKCE